MIDAQDAKYNITVDWLLDGYGPVSTSMKVSGKIHESCSVGLEDSGVVPQGTVVLSNEVPTDWLTLILRGKIILVSGSESLLDEYGIVGRCNTRNYCGFVTKGPTEVQLPEVSGGGF